MGLILNGLYILAGIALSPWLIFKAIATGKYRRGLWAKLTGDAPALPPQSRVWFHGVSVGEVHLLRPIVGEFRRRYTAWNCVISTTTDTGLAEARKHFPDLTVFLWPLDFSWAVRRAFQRVKPSLVVLAEGEFWPNFLLAAKGLNIPVAVVNGRMSPRSARRFQLLAPLVRPLFRCIDLFLMQTDDYAGNLRTLGVDPSRIHVTASVKYDGATSDRHNSRTEQLRQLLSVSQDDLIWIAGSTQAPEEEIALNAFRNLSKLHPKLRLFLVPRQKDRFDEVAGLLHRSGLPFTRRSSIGDPRSPVVLIDTIGELGALWGLADVAFVGGSLDGKRGGQNMLEPAGYGAAVVFGPHVWNFRADAARLVDAQAAVQVNDPEALVQAVSELLANPEKRRLMGSIAQWLVLQHQGATARTIELLGRVLPPIENLQRVA